MRNLTQKNESEVNVDPLRICLFSSLNWMHAYKCTSILTLPPKPETSPDRRTEHCLWAHRHADALGDRMNEPSILLVISVLIGVLALVGVAAKLFQVSTRQPVHLPDEHWFCGNPSLWIHDANPPCTMRTTSGHPADRRQQDLVVGWIPPP